MDVLLLHKILSIERLCRKEFVLANSRKRAKKQHDSTTVGLYENHGLIPPVMSVYVLNIKYINSPSQETGR